MPKTVAHKAIVFIVLLRMLNKKMYFFYNWILPILLHFGYFYPVQSNGMKFQVQDYVFVTSDWILRKISV